MVRNSGKDQSQAEADELRRRAADRLRTQAPQDRSPWAENDRQRLVHELEVHQIELEMQNEQLRQSRDEVEKTLERYTDLYDFAPVGYLTLDRSGVINALNLAGAQLLGIERARLIGRQFALFVRDDARPLFTDYLAHVFHGRDKESCELTIINGEDCPLYLQIEAIACESGKECHLAVIDVTRRKIAEDALTRKRQQLEDLNISLNERIEQAVLELRQKDQLLIIQDRFAVMGEMINNIAHQWRQPLNNLGLTIQELPFVYESATFSQEFLENHTIKSMELIQHMSQTIDDFRDFFRPNKEKVTFNVNQVIRQTLSLIEKSFLDQQIHIVHQSDGEPTVSGYPNELAQVLLNILINARDALSGNNINHPLISLHAFTKDGKTVVTIADNAGGIADEVMERLFDPYFTTKGPDQGTGIGLFMAKTIIENSMKGRLTVRNCQGGAEFRIEV